MHVSLKTLASAIALGLMSSAAQAQLAYENLSVDNSSYSTAQNVGTLDLAGITKISISGLRGNTNIFGFAISDNSNADFYSFTITTPSILKLSTTTPQGYLTLNDTVIGLYDTSGNRLIYDDDGGLGRDSLLKYTIANTGTYIAAVSGYSDFDFIGGGSTNFAYTLRAEVSAIPSSVPVPAAAWLMGSSLLGLGLFNRKRAAS